LPCGKTNAWLASKLRNSLRSCCRRTAPHRFGPTDALIGLAMAAVLIAVGCGTNVQATHEESEVRSLFRAVAANGRAHNFARICRDEMSGGLPELDYLVGGSCTKDLARDWLEGVQLTKIGPSTRVIVTARPPPAWPESGSRTWLPSTIASFPRSQDAPVLGRYNSL
jgi:hypothetical protein